MNENNQTFLPGGPGGAVFSKSAPPGRRRQKGILTMKVAVPVFKNRVSPRIDVSDGLFIYEIQKGAIKQKVKYPLVFDYPAELVAFLQKKGIKKIICGGCPHFFARSLLLSGFELLSGLSGDSEQVMNLLVEGKLDNIPAGGPAVSLGGRCGRRGRARKRNR
jgi:predicted Fe-Mo cluster-binding NifX family protein